MNRRKWEAVTDVNILVMKLGEEAGEVAKARLDFLEAETTGKALAAHENLLIELGHVQFMVQRIREEAR